MILIWFNNDFNIIQIGSKYPLNQFLIGSKKLTGKYKFPMYVYIYIYIYIYIAISKDP